MGCGLPTAPLLPGGRQRLILPCRRVSATSLLDLSPRVRDRCADNSAVQRELEELRRESYIVLWVIRSTMKDRCVVPELSQPLVWICDMQYVTGQWTGK